MSGNAFITGAASGIGRATARLFAARGWLFERRPDGAVGAPSFAPIRHLVPGR